MLGHRLRIILGSTSHCSNLDFAVDTRRKQGRKAEFNRQKDKMNDTTQTAMRPPHTYSYLPAAYDVRNDTGGHCQLTYDNNNQQTPTYPRRPQNDPDRTSPLLSHLSFLLLSPTRVRVHSKSHRPEICTTSEGQSYEYSCQSGF